MIDRPLRAGDVLRAYDGSAVALCLGKGTQTRYVCLLLVRRDGGANTFLDWLPPNPDEWENWERIAEA